MRVAIRVKTYIISEKVNDSRDKNIGEAMLEGEGEILKEKTALACGQFILSVIFILGWLSKKCL